MVKLGLPDHPVQLLLLLVNPRLVAAGLGDGDDYLVSLDLSISFGHFFILIIRCLLVFLFLETGVLLFQLLLQTLDHLLVLCQLFIHLLHDD